MPRPPASWILLKGEQAWEGFLIKDLFYLLKCSALWPLRVEPTFDLNDGGGFCELTATGSLVYNEPIKSLKAENLAAKGEPADILDGTRKDMRRRHGEPEELKLKKIVTYEELWVRCCHRYSMVFSLGECCWINTLLWHSWGRWTQPKKKKWGRGEWAAMQSSGGILYGREKYMEGR